MNIDEETCARLIERGEMDFDNTVFVITNDFQVPPNEAMVLNKRLVVLKQAHLRFSLLSRVSYNSSLDFERHYRALYDDICAHHDIWFDKLFNVDNDNHTRAEFATGILGTLCTILRQRGEINECNEVMKVSFSPSHLIIPVFALKSSVELTCNQFQDLYGGIGKVSADD